MKHQSYEKRDPLLFDKCCWAMDEKLHEMKNLFAFLLCLFTRHNFSHLLCNKANFYWIWYTRAHNVSIFTLYLAFFCIHVCMFHAHCAPPPAKVLYWRILIDMKFGKFCPLLPPHKIYEMEISNVFLCVVSLHMFIKHTKRFAPKKLWRLTTQEMGGEFVSTRNWNYISQELLPSLSFRCCARCPYKYGKIS